jgi:hypothetical protein
MIDIFTQFSTECLVSINVFKNIVAFIFIFVAVEWLQAEGYIQVYMIMFMLVVLTMLLAIPLCIYGPRLRSRKTPIIVTVYYPHRMLLPCAGRWTCQSH